MYLLEACTSYPTTFFVYGWLTTRPAVTPLLMLWNTKSFHYAIYISMLLIHHHWHIWYQWLINNQAVSWICICWIGSLLLSLLKGFLPFFLHSVERKNWNLSKYVWPEISRSYIWNLTEKLFYSYFFMFSVSIKGWRPVLKVFVVTMHDSACRQEVKSRGC